MPLLALVTFFGVYLFFRFVSTHPGDFEVYALAMNRYREGVSIYQLSDLNPYKYSPTFLVFFSEVFNRVKNPWSVFLALSLTCHFSSLWFFVKSFNFRSSHLFLALVACFVLFFRGYIETLGYGQIDLFLHSLIIFCYAILVRKVHNLNWFDLAGIGLAFSFVVITKPPFILLFFPFLLLRSWRPILSFALTLFFMLSVSWIELGNLKAFDLYREWVALLRAQHNSAFLTGNMVQNLSATLSRLFDVQSQIQGLQWGVQIIAGSLLVFYWLKKPAVHRNLFSLMLGVHFLVYPITYRTVLFSLVPAFLILLITWFEGKANLIQKFAILSAIICLVVSERWASVLLQVSEWDSFSFYGVFTLVALLIVIASMPMHSRNVDGGSDVKCLIK